MTATLLAVIVGSLCFSVGEGLRLRPFPTLSPPADSWAVKGAETSSEVSLAKYGPLDVPAQVQKRSKRYAVELTSGAVATTRPAFASTFERSRYHTEPIAALSFSAPHSGRAPPLNT